MTIHLRQPYVDLPLCNRARGRTTARSLSAATCSLCLRRWARIVKQEGKR